jgi:hypothetical protein
MKRPGLVTLANVLQFLLGLVLAGLAIYLFKETRAPETVSDPDAAATIHELMIGTIVLGVPALITLIAAWGMWENRFWGWALSLATDVGVLLVLVFNLFTQSNRANSEPVLAVGVTASLVVVLLPTVRKFYWK